MQKKVSSSLHLPTTCPLHVQKSSKKPLKLAKHKPVQKTTPEDSDIDEEEPEQPEQTDQDTDSADDDVVPDGEEGCQQMTTRTRMCSQ
jgi:hypothetical protein